MGMKANQDARSPLFVQFGMDFGLVQLVGERGAQWFDVFGWQGFVVHFNPRRIFSFFLRYLVKHQATALYYFVPHRFGQSSVGNGSSGGFHDCPIRSLNSAVMLRVIRFAHYLVDVVKLEVRLQFGVHKLSSTVRTYLFGISVDLPMLVFDDENDHIRCVALEFERETGNVT